jgi:hypothetical protein
MRYVRWWADQSEDGWSVRSVASGVLVGTSRTSKVQPLDCLVRPSRYGDDRDILSRAPANSARPTIC